MLVVKTEQAVAKYTVELSQDEVDQIHYVLGKAYHSDIRKQVPGDTPALDLYISMGKIATIR